MVQISPPSLSSPFDSTGSDTGAGLIVCLQVAALQSKNNDCTGLSNPPVSSSSTPSIPSFRNESIILSTLKGRSLEDEIMDEKRGGS